MALSNAQKQAAWRKRRQAEIERLRKENARLQAALDRARRRIGKMQAQRKTR